MCSACNVQYNCVMLTVNIIRVCSFEQTQPLLEYTVFRTTFTVSVDADSNTALSAVRSPDRFTSTRKNTELEASDLVSENKHTFKLFVYIIRSKSSLGKCLFLVRHLSYDKHINDSYALGNNLSNNLEYQQKYYILLLEPKKYALRAHKMSHSFWNYIV